MLVPCVDGEPIPASAGGVCIAEGVASGESRAAFHRGRGGALINAAPRPTFGPCQPAPNPKPSPRRKPNPRTTQPCPITRRRGRSRKATTSFWWTAPATSSAPITRCRRLTRKSDGLQVNAVLGFCNMLWKLLAEMKRRQADASRRGVRQVREDLPHRHSIPTTRRHRSETPEDLIPQFPLIREAVHAFEIPCLEQAGFEADDLIATYARLAMRGQGDDDHRVVRQGPDAARRQRRHHVRHHEGQAASAPPR